MQSKDASAPTKTRPSAPDLAIPALQAANSSLNFGKMDSDYQVVEHELQIEKIEKLAKATFQAMWSTLTINPTLTEGQFVQMTKTLFLKRAQDVIENAKRVRVDKPVHLQRYIEIPAPIADLLTLIGNFHSDSEGHQHHITLPVFAKDKHPAYYQVDSQIVELYTRDIGRIRPLYQMKPFPSSRECWDKPLMLTRIKVEDDFVSVRAWTNEPTMEDAYVRACNDELYKAHEYITYDNCSQQMSQKVHQVLTLTHYASSYVKATNA
jgi:hypothetical protein